MPIVSSFIAAVSRFFSRWTTTIFCMRSGWWVAGLVAVVAVSHGRRLNQRTDELTASIRPARLDVVLQQLRQKQSALLFDLERVPTADRVGDDYESQLQHRNLCIVLDVMNAVEERLSTANYSYLATHRRPLPTNLKDAFESGCGLCGNHVAAFLHLVRNLGFDARSVQIYTRMANGALLSHIMAEVRLGDKYRLVDVTHAALYTSREVAGPRFAVDDLLSLEEARALGPDRTRTWENGLDGWKYAVGQHAELYDLNYFLRSMTPADSLIVGGRGIVRPLQSTATGLILTYVPDGIPNYLGTADDHGMPTENGNGITLELSDLMHPDCIEVDIHSLSCNDAGRTLLEVRDLETGRLLGTQPLTAGPNSRGTIHFDLPHEPGYLISGVRIAVDSGIEPTKPDQTCYALWSEVRVRQRPGKSFPIQPASFEANLDLPDAKLLRR
jgi:hypothetical protein